MNELELMARYRSILPGIREWMEKTLEENRDRAVPVIDLGFHRLKKAFPIELLSRARAVVVSGAAPFPPLGRLGLPEFGWMERLSMAGVTFKDTFFIRHPHRTEGLHFHELVHVVQWERLGVDDFLLAYGAGLMQSGYENSPLEKMAYSLQRRFDMGETPANIVEKIQRECDEIRNGVLSSYFY